MQPSPRPPRPPRSPRLPGHRTFRCRGVPRPPTVADLLRAEGEAPQEAGTGLLWMAGAGVALWAAMIVFVGAMGFRGLLDVPVLGPERASVYGDATTAAYAFCAAAAALLATALLLVLMVVTIRPIRIFLAVVGFATLVAGLVPLATEPRLEVAFATTAINLAVGGAIVSLAAVASAVAARGAGRPY